MIDTEHYNNCMHHWLGMSTVECSLSSLMLSLANFVDIAVMRIQFDEAVLLHLSFEIPIVPSNHQVDS